MNVFDLINDISFEKQYLFNESTEKEYNTFLVNKAFMQHIDTVMLANELNKMSLSDKMMHFDYLFYAVDKKKRFGKWVKADTSIDTAITNIMTKYKCNKEIALMYYKLLSDDQKEKMNKEKVKGGR